MSNLTIGDLLPSDMKSQYPSSVLNVSIAEALNIAKFNMPPTSNLSASDVAAIIEIYNAYMNNHDPNGNSAYWNTSPNQNQAYWNTHPK